MEEQKKLTEEPEEEQKAHPLQTTWCFWYNNREERDKSFEDKLKLLCTLLSFLPASPRPLARAQPASTR